MIVVLGRIVNISIEYCVIFTFIFTLQAIATYSGLISNGNTSILYFSFSIYTVSWILLLIISDEKISRSIATILISAFPFIILIFFTGLFEKKRLFKYRFFFLIQLLASFLNTYVYFFLSSTTYYALSFILCYTCCFLICIAIYFQNYRDFRFGKSSKLLVNSFVGGFAAYIIMDIIPIYILNLQQFSRFYWTIILLIIFPISALILLRKLEVSARSYLAYSIFSSVGVFLVFFIIMDILIYAFLNPNYLDLLKLNNYTLIIVYLVYLFLRWKYEFRKKKLELEMTEYYDQKKEISYQFFTDVQFELVAKFLSEVLFYTYDFLGIAFVWSDSNGSSYYLYKSKKLANISRDFIKDNNLFSNLDQTTVEFEGSLVLVTPMLNRLNVKGLMFTSKEMFNSFSDNELNILSRVAKEVSLLLYISEQRIELEKDIQNQKYSAFERSVYLEKRDFAQKEKKNLANYLHDDVLQSILAIKNLNLTINSKDQKTIKLIDRTLNSLTLSMRDYMKQIYPSFVNSVPLNSSFKKFAEDLEAFYQLKIDVNWQLENNMKLNETEKVFFYRTFKELLTNAYKHSKATRVEVKFIQKNGENILCISDNGVGIIRDYLHNDDFYFKHLGLLSIKQEIDYLKGSFVMISDVGSGTDIEVKIPIMKGMI